MSGKRALPTLTSDELLKVAIELRHHAARHARTETEMTHFLDRVDEIRAEAQAMVKRRRSKRVAVPS